VTGLIVYLVHVYNLIQINTVDKIRGDQ